MKTEQEIKQELSVLLGQDKVDYTKVLSLTNELSVFDTDNVRFSVDAGIINRLGKELVGKGETAISELIKNGYDAEATSVDLTYQSAYQKNGTLIIEDDGNGMSYDELINGFMRLSSSDKIHNPISPKYKRVKAGRKGIGRFATQRLGTQLTIITQKEDSDTAIKTHIDWDNFLFDRNLNEIGSTIEYVVKEKVKGTRLIIENLRDSWSDASVQRAYRYTENLLQPEPLSRERKSWDIDRQDPGFKATFYREYKCEDNIVIDEDHAFYDHALAVIEGYIDTDGFGYWRCLSEKLEIRNEEYRRISSQRNNDNSPYDTLRGIQFKTHYFIYDKQLIPSTLFTYVKNLGNELGGIKLYRNGFRVSPYGEKGNDWLGFDESVRRRTYIFPHQNQSFFGFVEVGNISANLFEETSSREGLIENDAYRELTDFVYRAVISSCTEIAAARNRKGTAAQKNWEKKTPSEKIKESIDKHFHH